MRNLAILAVRLIIVLFIPFLQGCAREETIRAKVVYKHKGEIVHYSDLRHLGVYLICKEGKIIVVETNRALLITTILKSTELDPKIVQCEVEKKKS